MDDRAESTYIQSHVTTCDGPKMTDSSAPASSRRAEYAEATRKAIADAARQLFCQRGYFATKVDDIACLARVAPTTIYAVWGGKQALLRAIIDQAAKDPLVRTTLDTIDKIDDPMEIIYSVAAGCRRMREIYGDVLRVMFAVASQDHTVSRSVIEATRGFREAFVRVAQRLHQLEALQAGMDLKQAVDILWFYLGYSGLFVLVDENKWSYEEAEKWLAKEASRALLCRP
jgi:AcrR family transcriptional regulator